MTTFQRTIAELARVRTQVAEDLWREAQRLRAEDYPAKVGIEYVNGFEDAAGWLERHAGGTESVVPALPDVVGTPDLKEGLIGVAESFDGVGFASALRAELVELDDGYLDLDGIIARLEDENPDRVLPLGFAAPHSYRGIYSDLAFEPFTNITIREMLAAAREAHGSTYEGYKGGDYTMSGSSECWIANYGRSGDNKIGPLLLELLLAQPAPTAEGTAGGGQQNASDLAPVARKGDTE